MAEGVGTDPNIRCEVTPNFDIVSAILPAGCAKHTFVISQEIASCEIKASGVMRSSQKRSLLARRTKVVLPKLRSAGCAKRTFVRL